MYHTNKKGEKLIFQSTFTKALVHLPTLNHFSENCCFASCHMCGTYSSWNRNLVALVATVALGASSLAYLLTYLGWVGHFEQMKPRQRHVSVNAGASLNWKRKNSNKKSNIKRSEKQQKGSSMCWLGNETGLVCWFETDRKCSIHELQ